MAVKNENNSQISLRFFEDYWESLDGLSRPMQDAVCGALVRLFFTGEDQADYMKGFARNMYKSLARPVLLSRQKTFAGRKGGLAKALANNVAETVADGVAEQVAETVADGVANGWPIEKREKSKEDKESVSVLVTGNARNTHTPDSTQVSDFFKARGATEQAATKFYRHYSAQGWKRGNGNAVTNWQALAEQWISEDGVPAQKPTQTDCVAFCPECHEETRPIAPNSPVFRCEKCQITWKVGA